MVIALVVMAGAALGRPSDWRWALHRSVTPPPVPADNPMSSTKVALGRLLFYDADLSIDGTMSCATCHDQKRGFADGNRTRPGVHGEPGRRNVPGLANVAWLSPLTWADPTLTSLERQMAVPLFGDRPVEMGMKGREHELARRLGSNGCYVTMFGQAFPEQSGRIDMATMAMAVSAFQRSLISVNSSWDRYQRGDRRAISNAARRGAALFNGAAGCSACHSGANFTDMKFHRLLQSDSLDRGLEENSGITADRGRFRTPSLRNVAVTAPYLHNGTAPDLTAALAAHELQLEDQDKLDLIAFLEALTDRRFLSDPAHSMPLTACGKKL